MQRITIFGNSGAGKTTLANQYAAKYGLSPLDIDTLAWLNTSPPTRKPLKDSLLEIDRFILKNKNWVIEGCYADLLTRVIKHKCRDLYQ